MFFDKRDVEDIQDYGEVVDAKDFLERVSDAIKDKLFFVPDYSYAEKVKKDEAEEFLLEMYSVLKKF